jgi:microfibrillar-associated protein 1
MMTNLIQRTSVEEKEEDTPDVDDNDGIDPEGEFEAWRLRELGRIKRDKEDEVRREEEREEIERRRALPEEQRLREDMEHADKTRSDKPKGQQKFLQKYWHKGAFHQVSDCAIGRADPNSDESSELSFFLQDEEILQRHDFTEATASTMDVSMLPKVMQVKNFGKRGRTKYTHLVDQDTTQSVGGFGGAGSIQAGGTQGGCFLCGGPHMKKGSDMVVRPLTHRAYTRNRLSTKC